MQPNHKLFDSPSPVLQKRMAAQNASSSASAPAFNFALWNEIVDLFCPMSPIPISSSAMVDLVGITTPPVAVAVCALPVPDKLLDAETRRGGSISRSSDRRVSEYSLSSGRLLSRPSDRRGGKSSSGGRLLSRSSDHRDGSSLSGGRLRSLLRRLGGVGF